MLMSALMTCAIVLPFCIRVAFSEAGVLEAKNFSQFAVICATAALLPPPELLVAAALALVAAGAAAVDEDEPELLQAATVAASPPPSARTRIRLASGSKRMTPPLPRSDVP